MRGLLQTLAPLLLSLPNCVYCFTGGPSRSTTSRSSLSSSSSSSSLSLPYATSRRNTAFFASVVVVSPPGGVGEVAAVKAATMGAAVKWFVVSAPPSANSDGSGIAAAPIVLSQQALNDIAMASGKVELAGSDASSLLLPQDDKMSALGAFSMWCGAADCLVCTYDGVAAGSNTKKRKTNEDEEREMAWKNAIKVASREASKAIAGKKVAILSADEAVGPADEKEQEGGGGLGSIVGKMFGGDKVKIPDSLANAMAGSGDILTLRYGQLFGTPESSPDFSPLVGGPKKFPEFCQEYMMRSVRVDPTLSVSGNVMLSGSTTRSCRHAVGEAAALMALGKIPAEAGLDVSLSSQRGTDAVTLAMWQEEFARVQEMLEQGQGAQLFSAEFGSVPNIPRLADWLATKWAPTVLRTYEIAAIRVGSRPVYVTQPEDNVVDIIWQQLVNFDPVVVGKMTIVVKDNGLVAIRGPGDAAKGFGEISRKPLGGEDVLVRRLAEAASQAIEKGLANKPAQKKVEQVALPTPVVEEKKQPSVVSSLQSSGTIVEGPASTSAATGPRQAGVRRSTERLRGKIKKPKADE